ncbi:MAG: ankyrin repeat domain-containing protein [Leptospiraceae bacterium]|nr:ankyrin repeat domain-containing protein [Leptospiraceae bacterium]
MNRAIIYLLSCFLLIGSSNCKSLLGGPSQAANEFMGNLANAIHGACKQGKATSVVLNEVDSLSVIQGSRNRSGPQDIHSLSGEQLKNLGSNRMELHPGRPVMVLMVMDGEELSGSMPGPPCPVVVPAMSQKGSEFRIELLPSVFALVMASYNGDLPAIRRLVDQNVDLNGQMKVTPLIAAIDGNRSAAAILLLEKGANPNVPAEMNGQTALHLATKKGSMELVQLLVDGGADLDPQDPARQTPLWGASFHNHPQIIRYLVEKGANLHHKDPAGNTAMSIAAAGGATESIAELASLGLNADEPNRFGRTPLFDAIDHNQPGAVQALLKLGADPNRTTASGKTPLQSARHRGNPDILRMLQEAGAK